MVELIILRRVAAMFCLKTAMRNLWRRRYKSALMVLVSAISAVFVLIYLDSIKSNQEQLLMFSRELPVTARIMNGNGSMENGLYIPRDLIDNIESTGFVKDPLYTTRMAAVLPTGDLNDSEDIAMILCANQERAIPDYEDRKIILEEGASMDFLLGTDPVCLAGENFLTRNNLSVGDTIDLRLYKRQFSSAGYTYEYEWLADCSLRIIGSISAARSDFAISRVDILCPLGWAEEVHAMNGSDFSLDSASFTVSDSLRLNEFKAEMRKYLQGVNPEGSQSLRGDSLSVIDEIFILSASRVKDTLKILYTFAPVMFIIMALVGYTAAYLLIQDRHRDIAVMRSLGTSPAVCISTMIIEYAILGLMGCLIGNVCAAPWSGMSINTLLYSMLFFASLMIGISTATLRISRFNTMTGLIKNES
ncbi:MAG TPA: hypothetical protein GX501_04705 [Clostridiaceae bacterium]|nr:hypothetical protein [Clostridiaceae bacterium]